MSIKNSQNNVNRVSKCKDILNIERELNYLYAF